MSLIGTNERRTDAGSKRGWTSGWRLAVLVSAIVLLGAAVRIALSPQFDGLDDAGYLDAAGRVARGEPQSSHHSLFYLRVGMSYPLGWLLRVGLAPRDFWVLNAVVESVTTLLLLALGWRLWGRAAGLVAALLYASYPLAVAQATLFMPTVFQIAAITAGVFFLDFLGDKRPTGAAGFAVLSGVSFGLGYLVKEDVALLVPAVVLVAFLARYRSLWALSWVCAGAAAVVVAESVFHYVYDGNLLYRFAFTAGVEGRPEGGLQMAALWDWDGFIRPLLVMPYQVGLYWWFLLPALAWAFWRGRAAERYVAGLLCLLFLYLQFGSTSLVRYVPLPKSARYSAIMTPMLILVLAGWVASLSQRRRSRSALAVVVVLVTTSVPSLVAYSLIASERTRNVVAVARYISDGRMTPVYADLISGRLLRSLLGSDTAVRDWFRADFLRREMRVLAPLPELRGNLVFVDYQGAKVYTSSYNFRLPQDVEDVFRESTIVWRARAYPDGGWQRGVLEWARRAGPYLPDYIGRRVVANCADMLDNDQAVLLRVAGGR